MKKLIAGAAVVGILSFSSYAVLANQVENGYINDELADLPYYTDLNEIAPISYFTSFSGIVKEVNEGYFEGQKFVLVESADGQRANLIVSDSTYLVTDNEITVGAEVKGFFRTFGPATLIYPPQYNAAILAVDFEDEVTTIKADRFDENLVSGDQTLKLNIGEDTKIITQGGQEFIGGAEELQNRKLVVFYDVSTRSIPAIATPSKIVVMYEIAIHPIGELDEADLAGIMPPIGELDGLLDDVIDVSGWEILVNGQQVNANGFTNEDGMVMVPLRAIAEALDLEISWEWSAAERKIMLGDDITLRIGDTTYSNQDGTVELTSAPELVNGTTTYVPLNFFRLVVGMNNAYAIGGQIVIDNEEVME